MDSKIFIGEINQKIFDAIKIYEQRIENQENAIEIEKHKNKQKKELICLLLNQLIGRNIYWASPAWNKYETHIIKEAKIDVVTSDFFGKEYVGKECIKIFIESGGYYLSDAIGKTLFFTEEEAYAHTAFAITS